MAHIREPEGIDFVIQSPPLTEKEKKEISELIKKLKDETSKKRFSRKKRAKRNWHNKTERPTANHTP